MKKEEIEKRRKMKRVKFFKTNFDGVIINLIIIQNLFKNIEFVKNEK